MGLIGDGGELPAIPLITKIRIAALIIAAFLVVGGCKAALHPKLRLVGELFLCFRIKTSPRFVLALTAVFEIQPR